MRQRVSPCTRWRLNWIRISPWLTPGSVEVNANLGQPDVAAQYFRKAFDLRQHTSEKEKLNIQAFYYSTVTRELDK